MVKEIEITVKTTYCDVCGEDQHDYDGGFPRISKNGRDYCLDCAYKLGLITKREWCENHGISMTDRQLKSLEILI